MWRKAMWTVMGLGLVLLLACGGDETTAGGVGSGGSGVVVGPVTGYGSIVVAGVTYDDSTSTTVEENAQGQMVASQANLGDQTTVTLEGGNKVKTIEVRPSLIGPVSRAYDAQTGLLEVMGQRVRIVTETDTDNTATVLRHYSLEADGAANPVLPQVGDMVVVHGIWLNEGDSVQPNYVLNASSLDQRIAEQSPPAYLMGGQVVEKSMSGAAWVRLNQANGQRIGVVMALIDPDDIAVGAQISAWVPASYWNNAQSTWTVQLPVAQRIRALLPKATEGVQMELSGRVDTIDTSRREIVLLGRRYAVPAGINLPSKSALVQLSVTGDASGVWQIKQIQIRRADAPDNDASGNLGEVVSLKGDVHNPNWNVALPVTVTVRGVKARIDAQTTIEACQQINSGVLVRAEVKALRPHKGRGDLWVQWIRCTAL